MSTCTKYCQAGHKFIIDGEMAVGNTITVRVEPLEGYSFIKWTDGNEEIEREIYIEECGIKYTAVFEPIEDQCNKQEIFEQLCNIIGVQGTFEQSEITCEEIELKLSELLN